MFRFEGWGASARFKTQCLKTGNALVAHLVLRAAERDVRVLYRLPPSCSCLLVQNKMYLISKATKQVYEIDASETYALERDKRGTVFYGKYVEN